MPAPDQTVRTTERLWSEEVGLARADEPLNAEKVPVYEWSNGKTFTDSADPYAPTQQQPGG